MFWDNFYDDCLDLPMSWTRPYGKSADGLAAVALGHPEM
jgi:hypothetical protein